MRWLIPAPEDWKGSYEEIGPCGQKPGFPLAGGEGAQTAATASSGSRDRMRGRCQERFGRALAFPAGVWEFEVSLRMGLTDARVREHYLVCASP